MPKHVINQHPNRKKQTRKQISIYYDALYYAVKMIKYWPDYSIELQEFLDQGTPVPADRPQEFIDFVEAFESVYYAGLELGINEKLSERRLRTLARGLFQSASRRKYYLQFLQSRRHCASDELEIVSPTELEERYQYHLYQNERKHKGLDQGPRFEEWRKTSDCITFYDILS